MTTRAPEEEARAAAGAAPEEGARRAARMRGCVRGAGGAGGQQVAGHSQAAMKVTMPVISAVLYFSLIAETRDQKKIVEAIMHASEKLSTLYTVWYWPGGAGRASSTCAGLVGGRSV